MTTPFTQHLCAALIGIAVLTSCSRPVAYFQRGSVDLSATLNTQSGDIPTPAQVSAAPTEPLMQANTTSTHLDAYVRNDSKLVLNKTLSKRMDRMKKLLASTHGNLEPTANYALRKMNVMERLVLKKMNKKIGQQRVSSNPEKAMGNRVHLIGGIVLLIAGLVLLIAGTGTGAFIGLIVALVGALGLILGLFGE
ncbi:hypothetical protein [Spirosoma flavum]|uniref:DUF4239 domain-containing protein n=1 Tax=Spirosoma flavum TaxID=2048557 RepID=A0ABW6AKK3_9BACT